MRTVFPKIVIAILIIAIAILAIFLFLPENFLKKVNFNFFRAKPGSCLILTEANCKKGEVIPNIVSGNGSVVGFKLPVNTQIFSPEDGFLTQNVIFTFQENTFNGDTLLLPGVEGDKKLSGVISFMYGKRTSDNTQTSKSIAKAEEINKVSEEVINYNGKDYNLIVMFTKYDYKNDKINFVNDDQYIEKLFPKLKSK